ncbi:MAG: zinc ribbon domain-containing protein, partial [Deltaproteobacteria bacterium]|nr:zinc ribbon domain-containing protein [Deltaproteobacteria bacterium]
KISPIPSKDKRYTEHCTNPRCRKPMMLFMRYCPYCHKKVARPWHHPSLPDNCPSCRWSVAKDYWDYCAWCGSSLIRK